jgi:hypothetical protein
MVVQINKLENTVEQQQSFAVGAQVWQSMLMSTLRLVLTLVALLLEVCVDVVCSNAFPSIRSKSDSLSGPKDFFTTSFFFFERIHSELS